MAAIDDLNSTLKFIQDALTALFRKHSAKGYKEFDPKTGLQFSALKQLRLTIDQVITFQDQFNSRLLPERADKLASLKKELLALEISATDFLDRFSVYSKKLNDFKVWDRTTQEQIRDSFLSMSGVFAELAEPAKPETKHLSVFVDAADKAYVNSVAPNELVADLHAKALDKKLSNRTIQKIISGLSVELAAEVLAIELELAEKNENFHQKQNVALNDASKEVKAARAEIEAKKEELAANQRKIEEQERASQAERMALINQSIALSQAKLELQKKGGGSVSSTLSAVVEARYENLNGTYGDILLLAPYLGASLLQLLQITCKMFKDLKVAADASDAELKSFFKQEKGVVLPTPAETKAMVERARDNALRWNHQLLKQEKTPAQVKEEILKEVAACKPKPVFWELAELEVRAFNPDEPVLVSYDIASGEVLDTPEKVASAKRVQYITGVLRNFAELKSYKENDVFVPDLLPKSSPGSLAAFFQAKKSTVDPCLNALVGQDPASPVHKKVTKK